MSTAVNKDLSRAFRLARNRISAKLNKYACRAVDQLEADLVITGHIANEARAILEGRLEGSGTLGRWLREKGAFSNSNWNDDLIVEHRIKWLSLLAEEFAGNDMFGDVEAELVAEHILELPGMQRGYESDLIVESDEDETYIKFMSDGGKTDYDNARTLAKYLLANGYQFEDKTGRSFILRNSLLCAEFLTE